MGSIPRVIRASQQRRCGPYSVVGLWKPDCARRKPEAAVLMPGEDLMAEGAFWNGVGAFRIPDCERTRPLGIMSVELSSSFTIRGLPSTSRVTSKPCDLRIASIISRQP